MSATTRLAIAAATAALTVSVTAGKAGPDVAKSTFAVQWTGLSKACQVALATLVDSKSDISQCSRVGTLFNEVVSKSAVNPDESLVQPVQLWLEDELCTSAPCESATVTAAYTAITESCSKELEKQRWIPMGAQAALLNYEVGRKTLCLKDSGANDNSTSYCPAEVLSNIETSGTPITYQQGQLALENPQAAIDAVPTWTYCQPCAQGLLAPVVNVLNTLYPDWATQLQGVVDGKCGAGFANGELPASLEDGITYQMSGTGNDTSSGGETGEVGVDEGFDEGSTGFRVQALVQSAMLLTTAAGLVVIGF